MQPDTHHLTVPWEDHLPKIAFSCKKCSARLILGHAASPSSIFVVCSCSSCGQRPLRSFRSGGSIYSLSDWAEHTETKPEDIQVLHSSVGDEAPFESWLSEESVRMGGDLLRRRQVNIFHWNGNLSDTVAAELAPSGASSSSPTAYAGFGNWRAATIRGYDPVTRRFELKYHDEPKRSQAHIWLPFAVLHFARNPPATAACVRSNPDSAPALTSSPLTDSVGAYTFAAPQQQDQPGHLQQAQWLQEQEQYLPLPTAHLQPASSSRASASSLQGRDSCLSACSSQPTSPPPPPPQNPHGYTSLGCADTTPFSRSSDAASFQDCCNNNVGNSQVGFLPAPAMMMTTRPSVLASSAFGSQPMLRPEHAGPGGAANSGFVPRTQSALLLDAWAAMPCTDDAAMLCSGGAVAPAAAAAAGPLPASSYANNGHLRQQLPNATSTDSASSRSPVPPCGNPTAAATAPQGPYHVYSSGAPASSGSPAVPSGNSSASGSPQWVLSVSTAAAGNTSAAAPAAVRRTTFGGYGSGADQWSVDAKAGGADEFGSMAAQLLSDLYDDDLWPAGMFRSSTPETTLAVPALDSPPVFSAPMPYELPSPYTKFDSWIPSSWPSPTESQNNNGVALSPPEHPCLRPQILQEQQQERPHPQFAKTMTTTLNGTSQGQQAARRRAKRSARVAPEDFQSSGQMGLLPGWGEACGAEPQSEAAALAALLREWSEGSGDEEEGAEGEYWAVPPPAKRRLLC
ncbi:hypothetical protein Agub_g12243 [Astrephomene gubernaculifera]|uniref:Uncharacterized protein n=1 Tax=Astrephomene gubernaculifera TaxID=47775 RepID=A0AAD3DYA9_9CHLO|nr:hypothetical protein Agub_g12243 [Astrephomene gubernaculifera]